LQLLPATGKKNPNRIMNRKLLFIAFLLLPGMTTAQEYVPGKIILRYEHGFQGKVRLASTVTIASEEPAYPFLDAGLAKMKHEPEWDLLRQTRIVSVDPALNIPVLAAKWSGLPGIAWAEPLWIAESFATPNDVSSQQDYFTLIGANQAWALATGSKNVIVAITDTGVDYTHNDLAQNLFINPGESGGGKETNGIDDDGNGFIDDVRGWDFFENDNTPLPGSSTHGTHVTGIAAAVSNNGLGIASLSNNVSYLPVRAGFTNIPFGYQSVAYAAAMGAHIINCSWGATRFTNAGQEVIRAAVAGGALLVAAAGNEGSSRIYYPAGFPDVISVAATNSTQATKAIFSNYNPTVDIAAPGNNIYSTLPGNAYGLSGGTSMAAPVVSALAALLKSAHPDWNASHLRANILFAAKPIIAENKPWDHLTGQGYLWAPDAFGTKRSNLEIVSFAFSDRNSLKPDGIFERGESLELSLQVKNHGQPAGYVLALSHIGTQLNIATTSVQTGALQSGETKTLSGIRVNVSDFASDNAEPVVFIDATTGSTTKRLSAQTIVNPTYGTIAANSIELTISGNGRLGRVNPLSETSPGSAFLIRREGTTETSPFNTPLLSEGSLILASEATGTPVTDAARSGTQTKTLNADFSTVQRSFKVRNTEVFQVGTVTFASDANLGHSVLVQNDIAAWREGDADQTVILKYQVTNGSTSYGNTRIGLYLDFDMPFSTGNDDLVFWDSANDFVYQIDQGIADKDTLYIGATVAGGVGSAWLINNASAAGGADFGTYDGFTDEEKRGAMYWGPVDFEGFNAKGPADVSFVIASKTVNLAAEAQTEAHFILAHAGSKKQLVSQINAARALVATGLPSKIEEQSAQPVGFKISGIYPNPFNPVTQIELNGNDMVSVELFDITGRKMLDVASNVAVKGQTRLSLNATGLASGMYIVRASSSKGGIQSRKIMLLK
jgi:hypothetical protein